MKAQWYGDKRDLVKWGVLLHLAHRFGAKHILQVLYYRPSVWGSLEVDGEQVQLPKAVVQHFRSVTSVVSIGAQAKVEVIDTLFKERNQYLQHVLERIRARPRRTGIVFLDPDTGLEPQTPNLKHVLASEVGAIWRAMPSGDVLVFYQHQTSRNNQEWVEPKKVQFENALGVLPGSAMVASAPKIARDVVLFFVQKSGRASAGAS